MISVPSKATCLALLCCGCVGPLSKDVAVHPQGLLPSQDTNTTPKNHLELEAIGSWGPAEDQAVVAIRYGLAEKTEVYLTQDLHHTISDPAGPDPSGIGDAWIGIKHRIIDEDASDVAHAFLAEVRLPHGDLDKGLSSGAMELHLAHIRDGTLGAYGWTTNTDLWLLADGGGRPDPAFGGSLGLTTPLLKVAGKTIPLGFLVEMGGLWHPEESNSPAWAAVGLRIPIHRSLELQAAWVDGIGGDGPEERWVVDLGRLVGDSLDLSTPR